jgi:hypothetical protein
LTGGDAAVWKQQFVQTKIEESIEAKTDEPDWGLYKEFVEALKKTFQLYDKLAEALEDMKNLRLGDSSITEHNSRFCLLVSQTGMKDSPVLMPWTSTACQSKNAHASWRRASVSGANYLGT